METPYLLIKGFYQWRNYFYLYGWNDLRCVWQWNTLSE